MWGYSAIHLRKIFFLRSIARLVYSLLKHGTAYVQQGMEAYETHYRERTVKAMARHAKTLGYVLVPLAAQS